jgi:hypothetical protein
LRLLLELLDDGLLMLPLDEGLLDEEFGRTYSELERD